MPATCGHFLLGIKVQMSDNIFQYGGRIVEVVDKEKIICVTDLFVDIVGKGTFEKTVKGFFAFIDLNAVKHDYKPFEFFFQSGYGAYKTIHSATSFQTGASDRIIFCLT